MDLPLRRTRDGIAIRVRLTPRSSADRVDGVAADAAAVLHVAARVRAVPEKGAANAALERLISEWLDVPIRTVTITAGATARLKTVSIEGDPVALAQRLAQRIA